MPKISISASTASRAEVWTGKRSLANSQKVMMATPTTATACQSMYSQGIDLGLSLQNLNGR